MTRWAMTCVVLALSGCSAPMTADHPATCAQEVTADWEIPLEWYSKRLSFEQAQRQVLAGNLPADEIRDRWQTLVADLYPGDQLWLFVRPPESFLREISGEEGVVLNRGCAQVGHITTSLTVASE